MKIDMEPVGWRILIKQVSPPEKTKGGLVLPQSSQDIHAINTNKGKVVALGPLAYKGDKFEDDEKKKKPWIKIGDWVLFSRSIGEVFRVAEDGVEVQYRFVNDTDILAVFGSEEDARALKGYVYEGES